ncbi:MAG: bifunctional metallophosphatase/5'-nucleotidase [Candidatus Cloacimonetes bacterium]|nr:bifunctional metallophosphatase/5'-nucleotidase [Candidatus Cloacimonadota bacterium]
MVGIMKQLKILLILAGLLVIFNLAAEELLLDIMFTNDIHGGMDRVEATFINPEFPPILGGGGSHARYIKMVRDKADGVTRDNLLIDNGDFFMGRPLGTKTEGQAIVDYFNMVSYDYVLIGNHEYDLGEERLIELLEDAEFTTLGANIVFEDTKELVPYVKPYEIIDKMGVKIAIIGLTTSDTALMSFPDHIRGLEFLPPEEILGDLIAEVREKGADIVIVAGHMGLPYEPLEGFEERYGKNADPNRERRWGYDAQELAHEIPGIDVFIAGHMHRGFNEPWVDPLNHTLVFQGWAYGSSIAHVTLKIDQATKTISGYELPSLYGGALISTFEEEFIPVPEVGAEIARQTAIAEEGMDDVIGVTEVYLSRAGVDAQNIIGNFVCDAILEYAEADFAFINLGGIRGEIGVGAITYRDIYNVMPFDNQLTVLEIEGTILKDILETRVAGTRAGLRVAGITMVYSRRRDDFDRVTKLLIGGEPWQADKIYRVATSDFLVEGNAGLTLLTRIPEAQIIRYETNLRDALVAYVQNNSPIRTKMDNRWARDDNSVPTKELLQELQKISTSLR